MIIDDATFIRQAFPALMPQLSIRGSFVTVQQFITSGVQADLVILELQRVDKCPHEVRRGITGLHLAVLAGYRVCIYTQEPRPFIHAACLACGATGVVAKGDPLPDAQRTFLEIARGHAVVPPELIEAFDLLPRRRQLTMLTAGQRAVLRARAQRAMVSQTAAQLGLSVPEVFADWRAVSEAVRRYLQHTPLSMVLRELHLDPDAMADIWCPPPGTADTVAAGPR